MLIMLFLGGVLPLQAAEYTKVDCMLVNKTVSSTIDFRLGYGIRKSLGGDKISNTILSGNKVVSALCSNTEGKKLLSVDEITKENGDAYITLNMENDDDCKFSADIKNDGDGLSLSSNYKRKCGNSAVNNAKYSSGEKVCSTIGNNNWCGVVLRELSGAVEVKVNEVNCGGMLCTGLKESGCTGNTFLDVGYSGKTIVVKNGCLD
jgi:hypothetical protein